MSRIQLSIFVTPTLAFSGYVIDISSVVGFLSVVLHFVLVMHLVSCHHSHCIGIVFIKLASVLVPLVLSVVRSESRPHSHAPAVPPKYYFISGIKMFSEWVATRHAVLL